MNKGQAISLRGRPVNLTKAIINAKCRHAGRDFRKSSDERR